MSYASQQQGLTGPKLDSLIIALSIVGAVGAGMVIFLAVDAVKEVIERVTTVEVKEEEPPPPPDEPPPPEEVPEQTSPPPPVAPPSLDGLSPPPQAASSSAALANQNVPLRRSIIAACRSRLLPISAHCGNRPGGRRWVLPRPCKPARYRREYRRRHPASPALR